MQDILSQQIHAFHSAMLDDFARAARPGQSDTMALRLRANALALAKVQLAIMASANVEWPEPIVPRLAATAGPCANEEPVADRPAWSDDTSPSFPELADAAQMTGEDPATLTADAAEDRLLTGDALSRFVSGRLNPDESPDDIWQRLQQAGPVRRRHNPALPNTGFRSPSG